MGLCLLMVTAVFGLVWWCGFAFAWGGGFTALVAAFYLLFGLFGGFCYSSPGVCYFCGFAWC